jgi:Ca2+-dependent lipid-binding protein
VTAAMDKNGKSDPYVAFVCPQLLGKKQPHTTVVKATLNPRWENKHVPKLVAMYNGNREQLQTVELFLVVWDKDRTQSDDLIGTAIISVASFEGDNMCDFDVEVRVDMLILSPPLSMYVTP